MPRPLTRLSTAASLGSPVVARSELAMKKCQRTLFLHLTTEFLPENLQVLLTLQLCLIQLRMSTLRKFTPPTAPLRNGSLRCSTTFSKVCSTTTSYKKCSVTATAPVCPPSPVSPILLLTVDLAQRASLLVPAPSPTAISRPSKITVGRRARWADTG